MAINPNIRLQYASNINKNIFGLNLANDNEDDQQALKLISSGLSSLNTVTSKIQSILKNQILLDRFEYKEKARVQKEINAESISNNAAAPIDTPSNSINISPLMGIIGNMFDDLTLRVQNLAESVSAACGGSGLFSGGSGGGGGGRGGPGFGLGSGLSLLGDVALGGLVLGTVGYDGAASPAAVEPQATPSAVKSKEQPQQVSVDEAAAVAAGAAMVGSEISGQPMAPAGVGAAKPVPQVAVTKDVTGQEAVTKQGRVAGYEAPKSKDVSATAGTTQKAKAAATKQPKPKTPTVPKPKKAPVTATPTIKPAPTAAKQPTAPSFNLPSLFTGLMAFTGAAGAAGAIAVGGASIVRDFSKGFDEGYLKLKPAGSSKNAELAMKYFMSQGWKPWQAAGIVGNLQQESTKYLDPNITNQIGMYGIAQWDTSRRKNFERQYKKPIYGSSFDEQLQYIQWELYNTHKKAGMMLREAKTVEEATRIFQNHYEVAPGQNDNQRLANAKALVGQDAQAAKKDDTVATKAGRVAGSLSQAAADFYQKAVGEVKEFITGKPKNLTFDTGADLTGMKPGFLKKFYSAVHEYGGPVRVTSAYRSDAYQAQLWVRGNVFGERGIYTPARPKNTQTITYRGQQFTVKGSGRGSRHLMGLAVDLSSSTNRGALDPYLRKYGLHRSDPGGDPPHVQEIGGPSMESGGSIEKGDPNAKNVRSATGSPGWSLTQTKSDDPSKIQKSKIDSVVTDKKGKTPFIIQNPPPSSPNIMMSPSKGPQAPRGRSRDVTADFKRGFGL